MADLDASQFKTPTQRSVLDTLDGDTNLFEDGRKQFSMLYLSVPKLVKPTSAAGLPKPRCPFLTLWNLPLPSSQGGGRRFDSHDRLEVDHGSREGQGCREAKRSGRAEFAKLIPRSLDASESGRSYQKHQVSGSKPRLFSLESAHFCSRWLRMPYLGEWFAGLDKRFKRRTHS